MKFSSLGFSCLFILGILQSLGSLLGLKGVSHFAVQTSASPLADVFTARPPGFEYAFVDLELRLTDFAGHVSELRSYPGGIEQFGKSHLVQIYHYLPMVYSYILPAKISSNFLKPIFCSERSVFLEHAFKDLAPVASYLITVQPKWGNLAPKKLEFSCHD